MSPSFDVVPSILSRPRSVAVFVFAWGAVACRSDFEVPHRPGRVPDAAWTVELDPPADADSVVGPIVQIRVRGPQLANVDVAGFVLVGAELTDVQERIVRSGRLTRALEAVAVPTTTFVDGSVLVVAPSVPLADGPVSLVRLGEGVVFRLTVGDDQRGRLRRAFPPPSVGAAPGALVYCGDVASEAPFALAPHGPAGRLVPFVDGCVRFRAETNDEDNGGPWVPPPRAVFAAEGERMIEPSPLVAEGCAAYATLECAPDELPAEHACIKVDDDRILVRGGDEARLYATVVTDQGGVVVASRQVVLGGAEPSAVWLRGLVPDRPYALRLKTIGCAGDDTDELVPFVSGDLHDHVVLSEALANPLGPEPSQEWLEILNDGVGAAGLSGYAIADGGGAVPLPDVVLEPGARVLLVEEGFDPRAADDVPPPPGCLLVRLPSLGKNGLSNQGERIALLSPAGEEVSFLPATPHPAAGESVARLDDGSLAVGAPTPCAPPVVEP